METLHFAHPFFLVAGVTACLVIGWLLNRLHHRRRVALARFAGAQLLGRLTRNVSTSRRRIKSLLVLAAIFLLFGALAQPRYGFTWTEVKRKGIDILFALDTSRSMLAEDTKPNRLQRARLGIMDFVAKLEGDRVGLMPFAGTSYLMCPLTLDYDAFANSLATVTTDLIPKGGTNISGVIEEAVRVLDNEANHKILILLTDGENLEGDALESARAAEKKGLTIYAVGVGTPGGELIPLTGEAGFVKDDSGQYVTSKLDEETLTAIAEATGGLYAPLGNGGQGLTTIYQQKLTLIPKEELMERRQKVPIERFFWPLAAALVLLVLEFLLPEQRATRPFPLFRRQAKKTAGATTLAALFLLLVGAVNPRIGLASPAEEAYGAGKYLEASGLYQKALEKRPDDPKLQYNYGTTAYKNNLHDEAIAAFTKALKSDDLNLQAKAYYNRGNALYQKGAESRQGDRQQTIDTWQEALTSYDAAIKLNPNDRQAVDNRTFVAKKLETLKQEMEQQQNQGESKEKKNDQDQQDQKKEQDRKQDQSQEQNQEQRQKDQQEQKQQQADHKGEDDRNSQQDQDQPGKDQSPSDEQQDQAGSPDQDDQEQHSPGGEEPQPEPTQTEERTGTAQSDGDQQTAGGGSDQQARQQDQERRALGQMTHEEAENLLDALKNEESELNFVPRQHNAPVGRDW